MRSDLHVVQQLGHGQPILRLPDPRQLGHPPGAVRLPVGGGELAAVVEIARRSLEFLQPEPVEQRVRQPPGVVVAGAVCRQKEGAAAARAGVAGVDFGGAGGRGGLPAEWAGDERIGIRHGRPLGRVVDGRMLIHPSTGWAARRFSRGRWCRRSTATRSGGAHRPSGFLSMWRMTRYASNLDAILTKQPIVDDWGICAQGTSTADIANRRHQLAASTAGFARDQVWIAANLCQTQHLNPHYTSYGLKHLAEPEIDYVINGIFIAAVLAMGYRRDDGHLNPDFTVSERTVATVRKRLGVLG